MSIRLLLHMNVENDGVADSNENVLVVVYFTSYHPRQLNHHLPLPCPLLSPPENLTRRQYYPDVS